MSKFAINHIMKAVGNNNITTNDDQNINLDNYVNSGKQQMSNEKRRI